MSSKVCKLLFLLVFIGVLQNVYASIEILQGPSSRTTLTGPDGSAISALQPGGVVLINGQNPAAVGPAFGVEDVVIGPSGSIATSYTAAGPVVVAVDDTTAATTTVDDIQDDGDDDGSYKGDE